MTAINTVTQTSLAAETGPETRMPITKINAFLKEFPWVMKYGVPRDDIYNVYVSRISPEIIGRSLESKTFREKVGTEVDLCGSFDIYENVRYTEFLHLIDEKGNQVCYNETSFYQVKAVPAHRRYWLFGPIVPLVPAHKEKEMKEIYGKVCYGSTLGDKLVELKEGADSVKFVLSYWDQTKAVIIYKVPNGITLPQWIQKQIEAEQAGFQKECADIDAEAVTA
jgi:hypothetical protein